jgi:hypothetical protein
MSRVHQDKLYVARLAPGKEIRERNQPAIDEHVAAHASHKSRSDSLLSKRAV